MTVVRYEPWALVNRLHRQFDNFLSEGFETVANQDSNTVAWIPRVDVLEEAERFVVQADLPGVDSKDIEITAEKGVLTLRGKRHAEKREAPQGYQRIERVSGSFVRQFKLPENAQTDAIKAKHVNGVLEVSIPKQVQVQPKRIEIEAA